MCPVQVSGHHRAPRHEEGPREGPGVPRRRCMSPSPSPALPSPPLHTRSLILPLCPTASGILAEIGVSQGRGPHSPHVCVPLTHMPSSTCSSCTSHGPPASTALSKMTVLPPSHTLQPSGCLPTPPPPPPHTAPRRDHLPRRGVLHLRRAGAQQRKESPGLSPEALGIQRENLLLDAGSVKPPTWQYRAECRTRRSWLLAVLHSPGHAFHKNSSQCTFFPCALHSN